MTLLFIGHKKHNCIQFHDPQNWDHSKAFTCNSCVWDLEAKLRYAHFISDILGFFGHFIIPPPENLLN